MHGVTILLTGAGGFIGRGLVHRLLGGNGLPNGMALRQLILIDHRFPSLPEDPRIRLVEGSLTAEDTFTRTFTEEVDIVFHLASVPGGAAEKDFRLGLDNNLYATLNLLEQLRRQDNTPRLVFASTIGVYGVPMPDHIDETTPAVPSLSYGAHKLAGEILVADYSRRGCIDGISLRLPGIVARPREPSGLLSAFFSNMIRDLSAGKPFQCPVSAAGRSWWMSRSCVIDNLIHAATLSDETLRKQRTWLLPVLHASMGEVIAAIARVFGGEVLDRVRYGENPQLEGQFAAFPPLECPSSETAGFRNDGSLEHLVQSALKPDSAA